MQKLFITITVLITFLFSCPDTVTAQMIYGFKAGFNISSPRVVDGSRNVIGGDIRSSTGFNAGVLGEYVSNEWLSFQVQLSYDQRGAGYYEESFILGEMHTLDGKANLGYIDLPFLAKFRTLMNKKKKQGVYAGVGPGIAYLVHGKLKGTKTTGSDSVPVDEDVSDNINSFSAGIYGTAGLYLPVSKSRLMIEFRYYQGFTNDFKGTDDYPQNEIDSYGRVFSINLIYTSANYWISY